jgi:hypothetical protein
LRHFLQPLSAVHYPTVLMLRKKEERALAGSVFLLYILA